MKYFDTNPHRFHPGDLALAVSSAEDRTGRVVEVFTERAWLRAIRATDGRAFYFMGYGVRQDGHEYSVPEAWLRPLDPLPDEAADERTAETTPA